MRGGGGQVYPRLEHLQVGPRARAGAWCSCGVPPSLSPLAEQGHTVDGNAKSRNRTTNGNHENETIRFVGIYVGESSDTRVSERWC